MKTRKVKIDFKVTYFIGEDTPVYGFFKENERYFSSGSFMVNRDTHIQPRQRKVTPLSWIDQGNSAMRFKTPKISRTRVRLQRLSWTYNCPQAPRRGTVWPQVGRLDVPMPQLPRRWSSKA